MIQFILNLFKKNEEPPVKGEPYKIVSFNNSWYAYDDEGDLLSCTYATYQAAINDIDELKNWIMKGRK